MTVGQLIYRALRLAGVVQLAGRTPSTEEASDALQTLNQLIEQWNIEGLAAPSLRRISVPLTAGKWVYTMGPNGDYATRPARIVAAHVKHPHGAGFHSTPVRLLTAEEWAALDNKYDISIFGPRFAYYQADYPLGKLYLGPALSSGTDYTLEADIFGSLSKYSNQNETVDLPPGYAMALEYNLAVALAAAPRFRRAPMDPIVPQLAAQYKAGIMSYNAQELAAAMQAAASQAQASQETKP